MSEKVSIRAAVLGMQKTARQMLAQADDVLALLDELHVPDSPGVLCPKCGVHAKGPRTLEEHLFNSHGGPLPAHWAAADTRAEEAA